MARIKKSDESIAEKVHGRALVDIHRLSLKCGEFYELNAEDARHLEESGEFDTKAERLNNDC